MSFQNYPIVIVTPVYEDSLSSCRLFKDLACQFPKSIFMIVVDDGSVIQPVKVSHLKKAGIEGRILKLHYNVGHQKAIAIGISYIAEQIHPKQYVVIMDADGEDLPETIPNVLAPLKNKNIDLVVAQRTNCVKTIILKIFYRAYQWLFYCVTGESFRFGNFMGLKSHAVKRLATLPELYIHIAATVLASKLRIERCLVPRGPRYTGQSKMNFIGLVLHGLKGLMIFAEDVLIRIGIASAIIGASSVVVILTAIILKWLGLSIAGWVWTTSWILVLIFFQTSLLSLMMLIGIGVMRNHHPTSIDYHHFIEKIMQTSTCVNQNK